MWDTLSFKFNENLKTMFFILAYTTVTLNIAKYIYVNA